MHFLSDAFIIATLLSPQTFGPIYPHFSQTLMTNFSRTGISHNAAHVLKPLLSQHTQHSYKLIIIHNFIGCPPNGKSNLSLLPWSTKFLILVICHTSLISYYITSLQGPHIHLPVTYFLFCSTTFHLVLELFASLHTIYGPLNLFLSANFKRICFRHHLKVHYFQSAYPAPYSPIMCPDSLLRL